MYLEKIILKNFRNYHLQEVDFSPGVNVFCGENAQGKTNLLEAIYVLGLGKSYRAFKEIELIKWNEKFFSVNGLVKNRDKNFCLDIFYEKDRKKKIKINGQEEKKISSLLGILKLVIFSPADLQLIQGSPSERRKFIDREISQISPLYYHDLQQYNRLLYQRNNQLKRLYEGNNELEVLRILDQTLVALGSRIIYKRLSCLKKLNLLAKLLHRRITAQEENLNLVYNSSLGRLEEKSEQEIAEDFFKALEEKRKEEIARGSTLFGPHRDDFITLVNNYSVKNYGSQGQQRTAVLSLKLAELEFMKSESGEYPVLLLDDVMSELDAERREQLLQAVKNKIQTFITTTDLHDFSLNFLKESKVRKIKKGILL